MVILVFFMAWLFIYHPAKEKIEQLKTELDNLEDQIRQIEVRVGEGKTMGEGIKALEARLQQINTKFPEKEEEGLGLLSHYAQKQNVEILSIKSETKKRCAKAGKVAGKSCYEVPVSLVMKGTYQGLVLYMEALKESLPAYITFDHLGINKRGAESSMLSIKLNFRLYIFS